MSVSMVKRSLLVATMALPSLAVAQIPASEYVARRDSLAARVKDGILSGEIGAAEAAGWLRIDGWLAPSESCRVRLRIQGGDDHEVVADPTGRFSFEGLEEGFGQLSFHLGGSGPAGDDGPGAGADNSVVTPLFQL